MRTLRASNDEQLHVSPCSESDNYSHFHFLQSATHGEVADVLERHYATNGRPSAPDLNRLAVPGRNALNAPAGPGPRATSDEPERQVSARSRAPRNSKRSKDQPASPDTLAYYPAVWKDFLEEAKRDCRIVHAIKNPFPSKSRDLKSSVTESLVTSVVDWTERGTTFEPGGWFRFALIFSADALSQITGLPTN